MRAAERAAAGAPRTPRVHRADRVRDWVALALVVAGAALYGTAHSGMGSLARDPTPTTAQQSARGQWKMVRWNRYERMSRAGVGLVAVGALASLWSFAGHAMRRRRAGHAA